MSLTIRQSTRFRRDVKRLKRQGADLATLQTVIRALVAQAPLADAYRDHAQIGNWKGFRECCIQPNWRLIYRVEDNELQRARIGSHTDLFK
jgi:mRNA interferase YafQ